MNDEIPMEDVGQPIEDIEEPVEELLKLNESEIVAQINARFKAGLDESLSLRETWKANWRAYNNDYDDIGLLPWQCAVTLPLISRAVNAIAASVKDASIKGAKEWYDISGKSPFGDLVAPIYTALIRHNLDECRFSTLIEPHIVSALLTCSPAMIVIPDFEKWKGFCRIENVDMRCLIRDPSGRDEWICQTSVLPWATVKREGGMKQWDMLNIEYLKSAAPARYDSSIQQFIQDVSPTTDLLSSNDKDHLILVDEYWGPLYDETGELAYNYAYCVVGNKEKLLFGPIEDPWGDMKSSYIDADLMPRIFGAYARSYIEDAIPVATLMNQLMRRMMDGLAYDVLRAFIIRQEDITTASLEDLVDNGVQPGTLIVQRQGDGPPLMPVDTGKFPQAAFALFQILEQQFEQATGITKTYQGLNENRGNADITLGEVQIKQANAERGLTTIAAAYEDNVLRRLVERLVRSIQMYVDLTDERVLDLIEPELQIAVNKTAAMLREQETERLREQVGQMQGPEAAMQVGMPPAPLEEEEGHVDKGTPEWKAAMEVIQQAMNEPMNVRVSGITGVITKNETEGAMATFVKTALMLPGGPTLLNVPKILRLSAYSSGVDPDELLIKDADKGFDPVAAMQAQQMAQSAKPPQISGPPMQG